MKVKRVLAKHDCAKTVEEEGNGDGGKDGVPAKEGKYKVLKTCKKKMVLGARKN